jgi:hypothetical protein
MSDRLQVKKELLRLTRPGYVDTCAVGELVLKHLGLFLEALRRMD